MHGCILTVCTAHEWSARLHLELSDAEGTKAQAARNDGEGAEVMAKALPGVRGPASQGLLTELARPALQRTRGALELSVTSKRTTDSLQREP